MEDITNSKSFIAANDLADKMNSFGWNPTAFAFATRFMHRTVQQILFKTAIAVIKEFADDAHGCDLRNKASCDKAKELVQSGLLDDCHLPMI